MLLTEQSVSENLFFLSSSAMPELRTDIQIIIADVSNEESLALMCQQGVVILNCVGPVSTLTTMFQRSRGHLKMILRVENENENIVILC